MPAGEAGRRGVSGKLRDWAEAEIIGNALAVEYWRNSLGQISFCCYRELPE